MYSIFHQICTVYSIKYVQYFPSNMYSIFHQICTVYSIKYVQYFPSNMYSIFHQICTVYSIKYVQYFPSNMYSIFRQTCTVFPIKYVQYFPSNMYSIFHQICTAFPIKYVQYFPSNMYSIFHQICTVFPITYVQYSPLNMYSIYHKICIYALHFVGLRFVDVILSLYQLVNVIHLPIFFKVASLALGQSYDWPRASEITLKDMGEIVCYHATTYYFHQYWSRSVMPLGITSSHSFNFLSFSFKLFWGKIWMDLHVV